MEFICPQETTTIIASAILSSIVDFLQKMYVYNKFSGSDPPAQMPAGSFHKPAFMDCVREEYQACREGVGVMDLSSFTKIEVTVS